MKPTIYLSGPMSGIEDFNFPAFNKAADTLRRLGYPVVNPADWGCNPRYTWKDCLVRDLSAMAHVDVVVALPGWRKSEGASLENFVAGKLGIPVLSFSAFIQTLPETAEDLKPAEPVRPADEELTAVVAASITEQQRPDDDDED